MRRIIIILFVLASLLYSKDLNVRIIFTGSLNGKLQPSIFMPSDKITGLPFKVGERYGGYSLIKGYIDKAKGESKFTKEEILIFDGGDNIFGTAESNVLFGKPIIKLMNEIDYDVGVLGNRDFDLGLETTRNAIDSYDFPVLAANIYKQEEQDKHPDFIEPYIIKEIGDIKIGIIGLVSPSFRKIISPAIVKELHFEPIKATLDKYRKKLKEEEVDFIFVLGHLEKEDIIEGTFKDVDLILNGNPDVKSEKIKGVLKKKILSGIDSEYNIGVVKLKINEKMKLIESMKFKTEYLTYTNQKHDKDIETLIFKLFSESTQKLIKQIGFCENKIIHIPEMQESMLGHLVTDIMREKYSTDVAILNNGAIRAGIPMGLILIKHLMSAFPFNNYIGIAELEGESLYKIIYKGLFSDKRLQFSGIKVTVKNKKILNLTINDKPFDKNKKYYITTIDYLLTGGDGYKEFQQAINPNYTDQSIYMIVSEYIKKNTPLNYKTTNYITEK